MPKYPQKRLMEMSHYLFIVGSRLRRCIPMFECAYFRYPKVLIMEASSRNVHEIGMVEIAKDKINIDWGSKLISFGFFRITSCVT